MAENRPLPQYWSDLEKEYGLPAGYLPVIRQIESSGNPQAVSSTGAVGPFQFTKSTARAYGLGLEQRSDEYAAARAAAAYARDNSTALSRALGRTPTGPELYLAHQQGGGGAGALLTQPTRQAGQATSGFNIRVNSGDPTQSSAAFVKKFYDKYNNIAGKLDFSGSGAAVPGSTGVAQTVAQPPGGLVQNLAAGRPGGLLGALQGGAGQSDSMGVRLQNFMGGPEMQKAGGSGAGGMSSMMQGGSSTSPAPEIAPPPPAQIKRPDMELLPLIAQGAKKKKKPPLLPGMVTADAQVG